MSDATISNLTQQKHFNLYRILVLHRILAISNSFQVILRFVEDSIFRKVQRQRLQVNKLGKKKKQNGDRHCICGCFMGF